MSKTKFNLNVYTTWALTVTRKPHMALSGVLCSRPLLISKEKVTVSPSTCNNGHSVHVSRKIFLCINLSTQYVKCTAMAQNKII